MDLYVKKNGKFNRIKNLITGNSTEESSGEYGLSLELIGNIKDFKNKTEIKYGSNLYRIAEVMESRTTGLISVYAEIDFISILNREYKSLQWQGNIRDFIEEVLDGTDYKLSEQEIYLEPIELNFGTCKFSEVLKEIQDMFNRKFIFSAEQRTLYFVDDINEDFGRTEITLQEDKHFKITETKITPPEYNTIYLYGKDGMTVSVVNGGLEYIEDFSYYLENGIVQNLNEARVKYRNTLVIEDGRYTIPEELLNYGKRILNEKSKEKYSVEVEVIQEELQNIHLSVNSKVTLRYKTGKEEYLTISKIERNLKTGEVFVTLGELESYIGQGVTENTNTEPSTVDNSSIYSVSSVKNENKIEVDRFKGEILALNFSTVISGETYHTLTVDISSLFKNYSNTESYVEWWILNNSRKASKTWRKSINTKYENIHSTCYIQPEDGYVEYTLVIKPINCELEIGISDCELIVEGTKAKTSSGESKYPEIKLSEVITDAMINDELRINDNINYQIENIQGEE